MCLLVLGGLADYQAKVAAKPGTYVVLNVAFDGGIAEAVRLNIEAASSSCVRASGRRPIYHMPANPPFQLLANAMALSFDWLATWRENFATTRDAIGLKPLGNIPLGNPESGRILGALQECEGKIRVIHGALFNLPVETNLYRAYHAQGQTAGILTNGDQLTPTGKRLLLDVTDAIAVYSQAPELALPFRKAGDGGQPSMHGARLRNANLMNW